MQKILSFLVKIGILPDDGVYYIGGSDVLPPPLKGEAEQSALEKLEQGDEDARHTHGGLGGVEIRGVHGIGPGNRVETKGEGTCKFIGDGSQQLLRALDDSLDIGAGACSDRGAEGLQPVEALA